jgi:class 3 adenylate cyclase
MFAVVQGETARQVDVVVERSTQNAGTLFGELNELQRQQSARLAAPFTEGTRARALLDATIEAGDYEYLAEVVDYEMQLAGLEDALLVFTDAEGVPVLSMVNGERAVGADPANVAPLAVELLSGTELETTAYRLVDNRIYHVTALYVDDGMVPIGTITFGLPIRSEDVDRIGSIGGFEACLRIDGSCAVRTVGVDEQLASVMESVEVTDSEVRAIVEEREWSLRAEYLVTEDPEQGTRLLAVPLDQALAPFARIRSALLFGGFGSLLLSGLLGVALSRNLTRPVRFLVAASGRVADGDYDTQVTVSSHDEMGTLADAFNDMTRGLRLRERYRSVLNKVVSQDVAEELMKGDVELGGENRLVTVLFADIRGFTALTEGMEPQEVIRLLNECMERLSHSIDFAGGIVDKFIGDEVMGVFGAPATREDHARRAVTAALRMRVEMTAFNEIRRKRGEVPLGIGIGINTGVAVAGNMGSTNRLSYTVVGDVVNLASRLAGQAKAGEILISQSTLRLAGAGVVAPPLGGRAVRGFAAEVQVFSVESIEGMEIAAQAEPTRAPS